MTILRYTVAQNAGRAVHPAYQDALFQPIEPDSEVFVLPLIAGG